MLEQLIWVFSIKRISWRWCIGVRAPLLLLQEHRPYNYHSLHPLPLGEGLGTFFYVHTPLQTMITYD